MKSETTWGHFPAQIPRISPLSIWNDDAKVRVSPIYWMDVAVMSRSAGGKNISGLKLGASRMGSWLSRRFDSWNDCSFYKSKNSREEKWLTFSRKNFKKANEAK
jgi:hypothetical protein